MIQLFFESYRLTAKVRNEGQYLEKSVCSNISYTQAVIQQESFCRYQHHILKKRPFLAGQNIWRTLQFKTVALFQITTIYNSVLIKVVEKIALPSNKECRLLAIFSMIESLFVSQKKVIVAPSFEFKETGTIWYNHCHCNGYPIIDLDRV